MSEAAGAIRNRERICRLGSEVALYKDNFCGNVRVSSTSEIYKAYLVRDMLVSQSAYLGAIFDYMEEGGASRGSAIYLDRVSDFESLLEFADADQSLLSKIQETRCGKCEQEYFWRDVRPLPDGGGVFETVWRNYREGNIFE